MSPFHYSLTSRFLALIQGEFAFRRSVSRSQLPLLKSPAFQDRTVGKTSLRGKALSCLWCLGLLVIAVLMTPQAKAVDYVKANNTSNLNTTNSWTTGIVPTVVDVAVWDSTFTTIGTALLGGSMTWSGIRLTNNSVGVIIGNTAGATLTLGSSGIDMSAASANLTNSSAIALGANQTWIINTGRTLQFANSSSFSDNGYTLTVQGSGTLDLRMTNAASYLTNVTINTTFNVNAPNGNIFFGTNNGGNMTLVNAGRIVGSVIANTGVASSFGTNNFTLGGSATTATLVYSGVTTNVNRTISRDARSPSSGIEVATAGQTLTLTGNNSSGTQSNALGNGWVFGGAGNLVLAGVVNNATGAGSFGTTVTKSGTGTVTLSATNTFFGNITVNDGVLALGNNGATNGRVVNSNTITVNGNGFFGINRTNAVAQGTDFSSNAITGTGGFAQIGTGTTILTASNTYTGDTIVSAGALVLSNSLAIQNSALNLSGGALSFSNNTTATFGGLKGNGNLALINTGGSAVALTLSNAAATTATYTGNLIGGSSLTLIGSGTQILTGTNTYTGPTTIGAGVLTIGGAGQLGNGGSYTNTITISNGASLNFASSANQTLSNGISGLGSLLMSGSGTLTLAASNSYSGGTTLSGGTLVITSSNSLGAGSGTLTFASNSILRVSNSFSSGRDYVISSGVLATIDTASNTFTNSGVIRGNGSLTKIGAGTLFLVGVNTYTGSTTIGAGVLTIGGNGQLGNGLYTNTIVISNNAALNFASIANQTLSNGISGQGSLVVSGSGTLILAASNSYSGGTTINGGTLSLGTNNALGFGGVTITNGTLRTDLLTNSTINLPTNTMTLQGSSTLVIASDSAIASYNVRNLNLSGSNNVIINTLSLPSGTNTLITARNVSGTNIGYVIGAETAWLDGATVTNGRAGYNLTNIESSIQLIINGNSWDLSWTGSNNNFWNTNSTNWYSTNAPGPVAFYPDDNVLFTNLGTTNIIVTNSGVVAGSMTIANGSGTISFTGGNIIAKGITVSSNSEPVIFAGGGVTANSGMTNNGSRVVFSSNVTVASGDLTVTNGSMTVSNVMTVAQGSVLLGSGTLTASNANISSGLSISGGSMTVSNGLTVSSNNILLTDGSLLLPAGSSTLTSGDLIIANGILSNNGALTISTGSLILGSGTISGSGTITARVFDVTNGQISNVLDGSGSRLTKSGNGTVTLSGLNSYTGGTTINGGTLAMTNNYSLANGPLTLIFGTLSNRAIQEVGVVTLGGGIISGGGTISATSFTATNSGDLLISNSLTNDAFGSQSTFTLSGIGTTTLLASNGYSGGTIFSDGTLVISNGSALGSGSLTMISGTLSNDTNLRVGVVTLGGGTISGSGTITGRSFTATNEGDLLISNSLAGTVTSSSFIQSGIGTTTLYASNSYTGGTLLINGGALIAAASNAFGRAGVTNSGGVIDLGSNVFTNTFALGSGTIQNGTISNAATFALLSNGTVSANLAGTGGLIKNRTGTLNLSGSNSYAGQTTLTSGTLVAVSSNALSTNAVTVNGGLLDLGTNRFTNTFALASGTIQNGTIFNNANFTLLSNGTVTARLAGSGALIQGGVGTLILAGSNSYSGGTVLTNNGTINANNANALGGGPLTISNATLNVSNAPTLNVGGDISLNGSATISLQPNNSILTTNGSITISGTATNFINLNSNWSFTMAGTYNLIAGTNINFGITNIALSNSVFGVLKYGTTNNINGLDFIFTTTGTPPKSLVLQCFELPIQTVTNTGINTIPVATLNAAINNGVKAISVSPFGNVAATLNGNGRVVVWGALTNNANFKSSFAKFPVDGVTAISAGYDHLMALKNGVVYVAGVNATEYNSSKIPRSGITAVSAGVYGCLALKQDGTIVSWGWKYDPAYNLVTKTISYGGNNYNIINASVAVETINSYVQQTGDKVIGIADGSVQGMVLLQSGNIIAFGSSFGVNGVPPNNLPMNEIPAGLSNNVAAIAEGGFFAMALKKDGTVAAWGQNDSGQTDVPAQLNAVKSMSAGFDYGLALKTDNRTIVAWGSSSYSLAPTISEITAVEAGAGTVTPSQPSGTISYSVLALKNPAGNPVDDCQSSGGLQGGNGGGGGGSGGNVGDRSNPPPRSNPAPRDSSFQSSGSTGNRSSTGNRTNPPPRSAPSSR